MKVSLLKIHSNVCYFVGFSKDCRYRADVAVPVEAFGNDPFWDCDHEIDDLPELRTVEYTDISTGLGQLVEPSASNPD